MPLRDHPELLTEFQMLQARKDTYEQACAPLREQWRMLREQQCGLKAQLDDIAQQLEVLKVQHDAVSICNRMAELSRRGGGFALGIVPNP